MGIEVWKDITGFENLYQIHAYKNGLNSCKKANIARWKGKRKNER